MGFPPAEIPDCDMLTRMGYRAAFALARGLALPLAAQVPTACPALIPQRPITMQGCQGAAPVCLNDETGTHGQWRWVCPGGPEWSSRVVTNDLVIAFVKGGVTETSIIGAIMTALPRYSLTPQDLTALRAAGVSEAIIAAMRTSNPPVVHVDQPPAANVVSTPADSTGGEVTVKFFREVMGSKDTVAIDLMKAHIAGLGTGIEWALVQVIAEKGPKLYCAPERIGLDLNNYLQIIDVEIKDKQTLMPQAKLDGSPIGLVLVQGLIHTFPCK
jgi:hypothetical protein